MLSFLVHTHSISLFDDKKKDAQNIWSKDQVHEEPFGYRVVHLLTVVGYLLTSCPGHN